MKNKFKVVGSLSWFQRMILIILPIVIVVLAMGIGRMVISPVEVLKSAFEKFGYEFSNTLWYEKEGFLWQREQN